MASFEFAPHLNIYRSLNGTQYFGHQELEELGTAACIPFRTINKIRPKEGDSDLEKTAILIKTSEHSAEYFVDEKDLDLVNTNLKDNLRTIEPVRRYSVLSRRMQALADKYDRTKKNDERNYGGYVDWKLITWKTVSLVQNNPLKVIPEGSRGNSLGNPSITGSVLYKSDGTKVFQLDCLKEYASANLPVIEAPESYQAAETDLVIVGNGTRYVCKREAYTPILGMSSSSTISEVSIHIQILSRVLQETRTSLTQKFKNVVEWQDSFYKLFAQMEAISEALEHVQISETNDFKISSKHMPEIPFGCYVKSKNHLIFRMKIMLGNGATKDVKVGFSNRTNSFYARTKLNSKIFKLKTPHKAIHAKQSWAKEIEVYKEIQALQRKGEVLRGLPIVEEIVQTENDGEIHWEVFTNMMECNLIDLLMANPKLPSKARKILMYNILEAIYTYHTKLGRAHGDIKGDNFVVNYKYEVNLIDFGHSRKPGEEKGTIGSFGYVPPEDTFANDYYARDAWATGVVLYMVATGKSPCFFSSTSMKPAEFMKKVDEFHMQSKPVERSLSVIWDLCHQDYQKRAKVVDVFPQFPKVQ